MSLSLPTTSLARRRFPDQLRPVLLRAAYARTNQLAQLPPLSNPDDRVAAAHEASVRRILDEIHTALDRMDAGTYGDCVTCGGLVPLARLEHCAWTLDCEPCQRRR